MFENRLFNKILEQRVRARVRAHTQTVSYRDCSFDRGINIHPLEQEYTYFSRAFAKGLFFFFLFFFILPPIVS